MSFKTRDEILNAVFSSSNNTLNTVYKSDGEVLNLIYDPEAKALRVNIQGLSDSAAVGIIDGEVSTFADLPAASTHITQIYIVKQTTGIPLINRKQAGMYYSDGASWALLDIDLNAANVYYSGSLESTTVKAALDELHTLITEETITATAAADIIGHTSIAVVGGMAYPADNTNLDHINIITGIAKNSCSLGGEVVLQTKGYMTENSWNWVIGMPVFVGAGGVLTQATDSGLFIMQVGVADQTNRIIIDLKMPIRRA